MSQLNVGINDYFYKLTIHKNQIQLFEYQYDGQSKMVLSQDLLFEHKQYWKKLKKIINIQNYFLKFKKDNY